MKLLLAKNESHRHALREMGAVRSEAWSVYTAIVCVAREVIVCVVDDLGTGKHDTPLRVGQACDSGCCC
jgi:hypothetical protein